MNYEKLSRQALKCMYVATAAGSILTLAILGAVNYFIFFPKDLDIANRPLLPLPSDTDKHAGQSLFPLSPLSVPDR